MSQIMEDLMKSIMEHSHYKVEIEGDTAVVEPEEGVIADEDF